MTQEQHGRESKQMQAKDNLLIQNPFTDRHTQISSKILQKNNLDPSSLFILTSDKAGIEHKDRNWKWKAKGYQIKLS